MLQACWKSMYDISTRLKYFSLPRTSSEGSVTSVALVKYAAHPCLVLRDGGAVLIRDGPSDEERAVYILDREELQNDTLVTVRVVVPHRVRIIDLGEAQDPEGGDHRSPC